MTPDESNSALAGRETRHLVEYLRRASRAVYLVMDQEAADDLSAKLVEAASLILSLSPTAPNALQPAPEGEVLERALNERDLFINPHLLEQAADEIDCCPNCDHCWNECTESRKGNYCPNDVAETLRAVAKVARAALNKGAV